MLLDSNRVCSNVQLMNQELVLFLKCLLRSVLKHGLHLTSALLTPAKIPYFKQIKATGITVCIILK